MKISLLSEDHEALFSATSIILYLFSPFVMMILLDRRPRSWPDPFINAADRFISANHRAKTSAGTVEGRFIQLSPLKNRVVKAILSATEQFPSSGQ
jgi:hypothetical protein